MWPWGPGGLIWLASSCIDSEASKGSGLASGGHPLFVFCKMDMEIQSPLTFLLVADHPCIYHSSHEGGGDSNLRVIWVYIEEVFVVGEEHWAVGIVVAECVVDVLVFPPLVFYHFNYANVFYYYAEAVLSDNLGDLLWDLNLCRVLVIVLMGMYPVGVLAGRFSAKVESNSSDVFSGVDSWVKHGVAMFVFLVAFVVFTLLGSLVVGDDVDVVLSRFDSNEFDWFGFPFV